MTGAAPTTSVPGRALLLAARDIKLAHSVFALPFALLAMLLAAAADGRLPRWDELLLILWCMIAARTAAMCFNRFADAELDAANPRTAARAVPAGRLRRGFMLRLSLAASAALLAGAAGFWAVSDNPWPLLLAPPVLVWLLAYSYTKRFTWLCHLWLGAALALSPLAAAVAINPPFVLTAEPWLLAVMVAAWVGGFDVIYALQDAQVDRDQGLRSMPGRFGPGPALWVSRGLHAVSFTALVAVGMVSAPLGVGFAAATGLVGGLLILEHALVRRPGARRINAAFLTVNGVISLLLACLGGLDVWLNVHHGF